MRKRSVPWDCVELQSRLPNVYMSLLDLRPASHLKHYVVSWFDVPPEILLSKSARSILVT
jgi:hypothetical protein